MNLTQFETYIKEKGKKHIIFDFDDTICKLLIDWKDWRQEVGLLALEHEVGTTSKEVGSQVIQNLCIKKGGQIAKDKLAEISYRNEKECYAGYEILPVALPLINLAGKYAKLYIWTSNDRRTILPILAELKINNIFEKVVAHNEVNFIKPNPEGFSLIYDKNNPKTEYLIIGDSKADENAGQNAGIDFLNIADFELN